MGCLGAAVRQGVVALREYCRTPTLATTAISRHPPPPRLKDKGHIAVIAGGWVRDELLGRPCADIDIATTATAAEVGRGGRLWGRGVLG